MESSFYSWMKAENGSTEVILRASRRRLRGNDSISNGVRGVEVLFASCLSSFVLPVSEVGPPF